MKRVTRQVRKMGTELLCGLTLAALCAGCSDAPAKEIPASIPKKEEKSKVPISGGEFSVKAELDRTLILDSGKQSLYLLVQFDVPEKTVSNNNRPRLNCGVVIDRSGSMGEKNKIGFACASAAQFVDSLSPQDNLAVVEYDDVITTLYPSSPVIDKSAIKKLIQSLKPRGSTNLCGGMMQGVDEVKKSSQQGFISRVILLTDGLANQGIVDPQKIAALVRNARRAGISISTMGLGLDYDENLLQMIAENGGGNYYYIESATQMAHIFRQELNTLTEAVADNLRIKFTSDVSVDSVVVFGYETTTGNRSAEVQMSALHSGEKRSLLLKFIVTPGKNSVLDLGNIEINYNGNNKTIRSQMNIALSVKCTKSSAEVEKSLNGRVYAEALLIEADQRHEKFVSLYECGKKGEAKAQILALSRTLSSANRTLNDTKIAKKLEALSMESNDMDVADRDISLKKSYLKSNKQRLMYAQKGKRAKYILQSGDNGGDVEELQRILQLKMFYNGPIDGKYSDQVKSAVTEYQKANGIDHDGVAGPSTLRSMNLY